MKKWDWFISHITGRRSKKVAYFLYTTGLSGGIKILLEHVYFLNKAGFKAQAFSFEPYPSWYEKKIPFRQIKDFLPLEEFDWVVTSYFEAVLTLWENKKLRQKIIHFSQGFEGDYQEASPYLEKIKKAYTLPIPLWVVSESLAKKLKKIFPNCNPYVLGQGIDLEIFYPSPHPPPEPPIRIVLIGPINISIKRISWGLEVLKRLKAKWKEKVKIIRISSVNFINQEKEIFLADEYKVGLTAFEVAQVLRGSHVLFSPSGPGEGFGLPALEAMACGVSTCLSAIDSYLSWDKRRDYALFFDPFNQEEAYYCLEKLVTDPFLRQRLRQRGLEISQKFTFQQVITNIKRWLSFSKNFR